MIVENFLLNRLAVVFALTGRFGWSTEGPESSGGGIVWRAQQILSDVHESFGRVQLVPWPGWHSRHLASVRQICLCNNSQVRLRELPNTHVAATISYKSYHTNAKSLLYRTGPGCVENEDWASLVQAFFLYTDSWHCLPVTSRR